MWGQVGVIRSGESLIRACAQLSRWAQLVAQPFAHRAALEVKNMVQVAQCVAEAALWRENSVGAHYRSDFPEAKRAGWRQHSRLASGKWLAGRQLRNRRGCCCLRGAVSADWSLHDDAIAHQECAVISRTFRTYCLVSSYGEVSDSDRPHSLRRYRLPGLAVGFHGSGRAVGVSAWSLHPIIIGSYISRTSRRTAVCGMKLHQADST